MTLAAVFFLFVAAPASAGNFSAELTGVPLWRSVSNQVGWAGVASGGSNADFNFTLDWRTGSTSIDGGEWTLTFSDVDPSGEVIYRGTLRGRISGGRVTLDPGGEIASITEMTLTVTEGMGVYANVTSGSGTVTGTIVGGTEPFHGSMTLNY